MYVKMENQKTKVIFTLVSATHGKEYYSISFPDECPACGAPAEHIRSQEFSWVWIERNIKHEERIVLEINFCTEHHTALENLYRSTNRFSWISGLILGLAFFGFGVISEGLKEFYVGLLYGVVVAFVSGILAGKASEYFYHPTKFRQIAEIEIMRGEESLVVVCDRQKYAKELHRLNPFSEIREE